MLLAKFSRAALAFKFVISLILAVGAVVFALSSPASSQTTPDLEGGFKPYGSYHGGDIDTVNLGTGNLTIHIPLLSYPQRGRLKLDYWLAYNAEAWHGKSDGAGGYFYVYGPQTFPFPCVTSGVTLVSSLSWCASTVFEESGSAQDPINIPPGCVRLATGTVCPVLDQGNIDNAPNWNVTTVVDPMGGSHQFAPTTTDLTHYTSVDTTGMRLDNPTSPGTSSPPAFTTSDGTRWLFSAAPGPYGFFTGGVGAEQDVYGNQITVNSSGYNDSQGRSIPYPGAAQLQQLGCPTGTTTSSWSVPAYKGSATYLLCYTAEQIATNYNFGQQSANSQPVYAQGQAVATLLTAVVLPSTPATMWQFQYDSQGNLHKLTLPTGGSITYQWAPPVISCGSGNPLTFNQVLQSRTVDPGDGTPPSVWNYAISSTVSTVTDPANNDTVHTFGQINPSMPLTCAGYETNVSFYQGTGSSRVLLKSVDTNYSYQTNVGDQGATWMNVFATEIKTSIFSGAGVTSSTVIRKPDAGEALYEPPVPSYSYSAIHGVDSEYSFDYGVTVPATGIAGASRSKTTVWQWEHNSAYLALGLMSMPSSIKVADASGTVSETDYLYDEPSYSPGLVQGDPTTITAVNLTGITSSSPKTHTAWNNLGQKTASYDANLNSPTLYSYDASICGGSVLTSTTDPLGHTISGTYDCPSDLLTSITDSNQNKTNFAYDVFSRIKSATYPDGGSTGFVYDDTNKLVTRTVAASPDPDQTTNVAFDGLGREMYRTMSAGSSVLQPAPLTNEVDTHYDAMGRVASVTDPYVAGQTATANSTSTVYDALGRPVQQNAPDGTSKSTCYNGIASGLVLNCLATPGGPANMTWIDSTDEAGNTTRRSSDSFGRLRQVLEPNAQRQPALETDYGYDSLDNLLTVSQLGTGTEVPRNRYFLYDSLSRLVASNNPETGTICYGSTSGNAPPFLSAGGQTNCTEGYDLNGNLLTKTDARGSAIGYSYDPLNRLLSRTFGTGPSSILVDQYSYDGNVGIWASPSLNGASPNTVGRLSFTRSINPTTLQTCDITSTRNCDDQYFGYDAMGRLKHLTAAPPSVWGSQAYFVDATYNLAGAMMTLDYPDGVTSITQTHDAAGRLASVSPAGANTIPYAQLSYLPSGSPQTIKYGNGVTENLALNSRLQPCEHNAFLPGTVGGSMIFDKQYFYSPTSWLPCGNQTGNNGNIFGINDVTNPPQGSGKYSQTFTYDPLNRLASFTADYMAGQGRHQDFTIDSFGNITGQNSTEPPVGGGADPLAFQATYDANNHITSYNCLRPGFATFGAPPPPYDASGNLGCLGTYGFNGQTYAWDGDSRLAAVYKQQNGTAYSSASIYTYDASGNRIRSDQVPSIQPDFAVAQVLFGPVLAAPTYREYTYFGGQMLGEQDQDDNWTNYIYAGGKKVAMVPGTETQLVTSVVSAGENQLGWTLPAPTNADGTPYTVKTGDHLCWRQYNTGGALGGPGLFFTNGQSTYWRWGDLETGAYVNQGGTQNAWSTRCGDLSGGGYTTGWTVAALTVEIDFTPPPGTWGIRYADMSITSADGTVTPIALTVISSGFQGSSYSSPIAYTASVPLDGDPTEVPETYAASTHYFLADQVGTTQLEFASGGYPVWRGDFAPFGQELDVQATANRYKFTGKERDTESGLDYFGARYYASSMGRFMSPDWAAKAEPVPYAKCWTDPQSLNLYSYVRNNPLGTT